MKIFVVLFFAALLILEAGCSKKAVSAPEPAATNQPAQPVAKPVPGPGNTGKPANGLPAVP